MPARRSLESPPHRPSLDASGGQVCLDFVNTWGDRGRPETDRLRSYADVIAFVRESGSLAAAAAARLSRRARHQPAGAARALDRILELREALYRVLAAVAADRKPPAADLDELNAALPAALARLRLLARPSGCTWSWAAPGSDLEAPLWPALCSAAELLTSARAGRVRECAAERCTWLFLDRSRNGSRRWCDMRTCGNRAKARRHYRRRLAARRRR